MRHKENIFAQLRLEVVEKRIANNFQNTPHPFQSLESVKHTALGKFQGPPNYI